jgi:HPt (histidine-containing phosphotransfer) domain-containing protein
MRASCAKNPYWPEKIMTVKRPAGGEYAAADWLPEHEGKKEGRGMSESLIDPEAWAMLKSMGEPAFLIELIDVYLSDSPELIEQIRAGLASGDCESVRRAAHSLKSNSASFGATRLASASRDMEMIAKSGTLDGADEKLATIEAEYAQLVPQLRELKNDC